MEGEGGGAFGLDAGKGRARGSVHASGPSFQEGDRGLRGKHTSVVSEPESRRRPKVGPPRPVPSLVIVCHSTAARAQCVRSAGATPRARGSHFADVVAQLGLQQLRLGQHQNVAQLPGDDQVRRPRGGLRKGAELESVWRASAGQPSVMQLRLNLRCGMGRSWVWGTLARCAHAAHHGTVRAKTGHRRPPSPTQTGDAKVASIRCPRMLVRPPISGLGHSLPLFVMLLPR